MRNLCPGIELPVLVPGKWGLWRKRVLRLLHPDKGGDPEKFVLVKEVFEGIIEEGEHHPRNWFGFGGKVLEEVGETDKVTKAREKMLLHKIERHCVRDFRCSAFTINSRRDKTGKKVSFFVQVRMKYTKGGLSSTITLSSGWTGLKQLLVVLIRNKLPYKIAPSVYRQGFNFSS